MKIKTIDKTIRAKMDEWLATMPEDLAKLVKDEIVVTGGSIASMLLQENVNDFDVYFMTDNAAAAVAEHYLASSELGVGLETKYHTDSDGLGYVTLYRGGEVVSRGENANDTEEEGHSAQEDSTQEGGKYVVKFLSENAITLSDKVQVVLRFCGTPEQIHSSYDFVHATNYWTYETGVVTNKPALEAILARELIYRGSKYPLASIFRTRKFIQRGWSMHIGNYVMMAMQLNQLDLNNTYTLKEQLTGVDALYLRSLMVAIEQSSEDGEIKSVEYVIALCQKLIGE